MKTIKHYKITVVDSLSGLSIVIPYINNRPTDYEFNTEEEALQALENIESFYIQPMSGFSEKNEVIEDRHKIFAYDLVIMKFYRVRP